MTDRIVPKFAIVDKIGVAPLTNDDEITVQYVRSFGPSTRTMMLTIIKMNIMPRFVIRDLLAHKICDSHSSCFLMFASLMRSSSV